MHEDVKYTVWGCDDWRKIVQHFFVYVCLCAASWKLGYKRVNSRKREKEMERERLRKGKYLPYWKCISFFNTIKSNYYNNNVINFTTFICFKGIRLTQCSKLIVFYFGFSLPLSLFLFRRVHVCLPCRMLKCTFPFHRWIFVVGSSLSFLVFRVELGKWNVNQREINRNKKNSNRQDQRENEYFARLRFYVARVVFLSFAFYSDCCCRCLLEWGTRNE